MNNFYQPEGNLGHEGLNTTQSLVLLLAVLILGGSLCSIMTIRLVLC